MNVNIYVYSFIIGLFSLQIESMLLSLRHGYTLQGAVTIRTFITLSFEQCQDFCLSRKRCLSLEFDRQCSLCRLSSSDSSSVGVQLNRKARTIYSEKALWNTKFIDPQCTNCSVSETCIVMQGGSVSCNISECEEPAILDPNSDVLGNMRTVGDNILHSCNDMAGISNTSTCGEDGLWSTQQFECPVVNLEGKRFMIYAKANNKYWHFDGGHPNVKAVTSLWQPTDNFVKFWFEKQTDGSYKIKSAAQPIYMYDGYGVAGAHASILNGNDNTDDDHIRYLVSRDGQDYYRIQTKATGRYVRLDPDQDVSSRYNIIDDRSLFKLVEV